MSAQELEKLKKNCFFNADCIVNRERQYIEMSPSIQEIMGGLYGGSFMIVTGPQKAGKTVTCLDIAKRAQQCGYKILYADVEHRLHSRDLLGIKGLDLSDEKFEVLRSAAGFILNAEDIITLIYQRMQTEDKLLVITDSVSQLCPKDLREGDIGDRYRDSTPALLSRFSKVLAPILGITNNIFIGITHQIANTSGMGRKLKLEASGNKIQYAMDFKLVAKYYKPWTVKIGGEDHIVGQDIFWECENSLIVNKGREATGKFKFGTPDNPAGIDDIAELLPLAINYQIVKRAGAWFSLGDFKTQGEDKFVQAMKEDEELYKKVAERVKTCQG